MGRLIIIFPIVLLAGCGESQPPELKNAVVTVNGTPDTEVYLSVDRISRRVDGEESATTGTSNYGVWTLDKNGQMTRTFQSDHGLDIVLVALSDDPLKLSAKADNAEQQLTEVSGKLLYGQIKLGYKPDPDSMFANDPDDSVYEAKKHLESKTSLSDTK